MGAGTPQLHEGPGLGPQSPALPGSSSVRCRAHLDLSPQAHSSPSLCLCLSRTPARESLAPTCSPRREPCSPEPLSGIAAPSRARGPGPQTPLSLSPLQRKFHPTPCHLPQMAVPPGATTAFGTRLCPLPTSSGLEEHLRLEGGWSSGSDGTQEAASRDHLPAPTLEEGLPQGRGLSLWSHRHLIPSQGLTPAG